MAAKAKQEAAKPEAPKPQAAPVKTYRVAKRKAVGTTRGVIGKEGEVFPSDFPGGIARVTELVRAGYLVEVES